MRVLIHSNREILDRNLEPVDYTELPILKKKWGGNVGNKLFLTAMDVYCHMDNVEYEYLTNNMTPEYINENFDLILWPLANCFNPSKEIMGYLEGYTERIKKYNIPVLALGAGAQAKSYDDIDDLVDAIKPTAKRFIDAVHATGGIFGLRGYFTGEVFKKLGYVNDLVTGCPSMYQMGRDLQIDKHVIDEKRLRLAINGDAASMRIYRENDIYNKYPNTWFVDQGEYVNLLYDNKRPKIGVREIRKYMLQCSRMGIEMLADNRIICIYDLPRLAEYLKSLKLDFSFGQRIHGNILCTLMGIPAIVHVHDSRTKELAEFFNIPMYEGKCNRVDVLEAYENAEWGTFNKEFQSKYDQFEKLLMSYGMPAISKNQYNMLIDVERYKMPKYMNDYSEIKRLLKYEFLWCGIK